MDAWVPLDRSGTHRFEARSQALRQARTVPASPTAPAEAEVPTPGSPPARYMPALDGLRAVAVLAVIAYHINLPAAPGGLLGVGVFFVLSGYLITDLLLGERERTGAIALGAFWQRRARRLLPALFVMLAAVTAATALVEPAQIGALWGALAAAVTYSSNWWLIFHHVSYFQSFGPPSPLGHLWSLAVEEQFYLVWPLVLLALAGALARGRRGLALFVVLALAVASTVLMAMLYQPGSDPTRVYDGTDTRAAALLVGAALALVWPSRRLVERVYRARSGWADLAGLAGLAVIALMVWRVGQYSTFLYRGGFLVLSVATAGAVAALAHPATRLARLFSWAPLRWLGERSYGIYLWHYPVIALTTPLAQADAFVPWRAALQVGASVVLAAASYAWVERPIRKAGLAGLIRAAARRRRTRPARRVAATGAAAAGFAIGWIALGGVTALAPAPSAGATALLRPGRPAVASTGHADTEPAIGFAVPAFGPPATAVTAPVVTATPPGSGPTPPAAPPAGSGSTTGKAAPPATGPTPPALPPAGSASTTGKAAPPSGSPPHIPATPPAGTEPTDRCAGVTAIGDSIMVDAAPYLRRLIPGIVISAKVGRQLDQAPAVVEKLAAAGRLGSCVIIELGTNGPFTTAQLDALLAQLGPSRHVVLVNTRVPRPWQGVVNTALASATVGRPNASLVDWYAASAGKGAYFWPDGVHLDPTGSAIYARLLASAVQQP